MVKIIFLRDVLKEKSGLLLISLSFSNLYLVKIIRFMENMTKWGFFGFK